MNPFLKDLVKNFECDSKNSKERYNEFLWYCYSIFEKKIKSKKSEKFRNKYSILRDNTLKYLITNEKKITLEISR